MTRVYVIRAGSYSDAYNKGSVIVFSTVEKALAYKAIDQNASNNASDLKILVSVLDNEEDTGPVYPIWQIGFDVNGNVMFLSASEKEAYEPLLHRPYGCYVNPTWVVRHFQEYPTLHIMVEAVYAPDLIHAVKIAADARRMFLAEPRRAG